MELVRGCRALGVVCAAVLSAGSWAAAQSSGPAPIQLTQCRIKLIHEADLAAERSGVLESITVREGDVVAAGQIVARMRDTVAQATFTVAEKQAGNDVEIRFARKSSDLANAEFVKALQANKEVPGAFPEVEVRRLRMASEKALLQIEQAEHQFLIAELKRDESKAQLQAYLVEAPFDGVVTKVHKSRGEALREGEPIVEIASTRQMRVEGVLDVKDSYHVKRDAFVEVALDIAGTNLEVEKVRFPGRIEFVDVKVQPVTQKVRVWAEVLNEEDALKDGLIANMTIHPGERLQRPKAATAGNPRGPAQR